MECSRPRLRQLPLRLVQTSWEVRKLRQTLSKTEEKKTKETDSRLKLIELNLVIGKIVVCQWWADEFAKDIGSNKLIGAGLAQWWERSPSTNVCRVRFPDPASYVGWVCWFSTLLRQVFLRVLWFFPLLKNQRLTWFIWFVWFIWFDLFDLQSPQLVEH